MLNPEPQSTLYSRYVGFYSKLLAAGLPVIMPPPNGLEAYMFLPCLSVCDVFFSGNN